MSSCAPWDVQCWIDQAAATIGAIAGGAAAQADADAQAAANAIANLIGQTAAAAQPIEQIGAQIAGALPGSAGTSPIVIHQSADYHSLISGAFADGWQVVRMRTIHPDISGALAAGHLTLEAVEWKDLAFLGLGNLDLAASNFEQYIAQQGSQLYAWAVMEHTDFDALGVEIKAYRLLLLHSQIQIGAGAIIAILVAAFLAVIIWQYVTTGSSPVLDELQKVWSDLISATVKPIATAGLSVWVIGIGLAGAAALAFGVAGKKLGVAAPPAPKAPSVKGEVKTKVGGFGIST